MHAIVCHRHGGPEVMQYEEVRRPEPAAGQLLLRASAIGVNFVDTMRRSGNHPAAPAPPFTPGIELCGHVTAVGDGAGDFRTGDRVIGRCVANGAYAEYVALEARFAVKCPDAISDNDAAALFVNGQTAYHALVTVGRVRPGENVLVTAAAGGVGICALQIAKILGARVIATAGTDEKLELARRFGADETVNYSEPKWPEDVLRATGEGADVILESVGGDVAKGCLACWAPGGRLVIYGKASGQPAVVTTNELLFSSRTAYGLAVGTVIEDAALMRQAMEQLFDWHAGGKFRLLIGHEYPLRDAAAAHRALEGRETHGKIILVP